MTRIEAFLFPLSIILLSILSAGYFHAGPQISHTWVSRTGGGTTCTQVAPCLDFSAALEATLPGGVISVLTSGDYTSINITKSVTVRAESIDGGGTLAPNIGNF